MSDTVAHVTIESYNYESQQNIDEIHRITC